MKVGYFVNAYLPNRYGSANSIQAFRKGLHKLGHEVYVFAPYFYGYKDEDSKIIRYPSFHWRYKIDYPLALSFYPPMDMVVKSLDLDLIHCHQPFGLGKTGLKFSQKLNLPVVFTNHSKYEEYTHYIPLPFLQKYLKKYVLKKATQFANNCDQVIVPSSAIKEAIKNRGVTKPIKVLPTGVYWNNFQIDTEKEVRREYRIRDDEILLLNVGRIENEKNIDFLFDSAIRILKKYKNTKFMIAGEGSRKKDLIDWARMERLESRIIFIGIVPHQEIVRYYQAGDIFIHASTSETQGMTINEAMAAGLSIVAVKASGVEDSIKNNFDGTLTSENKEEFISAVEELINNKDKRKKLSSQAIQSAKELDYMNQAKKLEKIYEGLILK